MEVPTIINKHYHVQNLFVLYVLHAGFQFFKGVNVSRGLYELIREMNILGCEHSC